MEQNMKGFFIIYYDDIRGPVLEDRFIYLLDPTTHITEDMAEQVFYSLNMKRAEENYIYLHVANQDLCSYFTSQVRRKDVPVIFNVILDAGEPREKYFGFIKKWTEFIYHKMVDGTPFTINPIIRDIEHRLETISFDHARFKILSQEINWAKLDKSDHDPIEGRLGEKLQALGLINAERMISDKALQNLVDFRVNEDFPTVSENMNPKPRVELAKVISAKLVIIQKIYRQSESLQEIHFLDRNNPHKFFSLFQDADAYRILKFLETQSLATAWEIARELSLDSTEVQDYLEMISAQAPALATCKINGDFYAYLLLVPHLRIPYPEDPAKIHLEMVQLEKADEIVQFEELARAREQKKDKKRQKPTESLTKGVIVTPTPPVSVTVETASRDSVVTSPSLPKDEVCPVKAVVAKPVSSPSGIEPTSAAPSTSKSPTPKAPTPQPVPKTDLAVSTPPLNHEQSLTLSQANFLSLGTTFAKIFIQAQNPPKPAPVQGATTPAPAKTPANPTPTQGPSKAIPAQGAIKPAPAQGPAKPAPPKEPAKPTLTQGATKPGLAQGSTKPDEGENK